MQLEIDNLVFTIQRSPRRRTIGITIERNGNLVITAPVGCSLETIKEVARQKQIWVYTKLAERQGMRQREAKRYVTGEGHHYLGRSYRLLLMDTNQSTVPPLQLRSGRFVFRRDARDTAAQHFMHWYTRRAQPWLEQRVIQYSELIGIDSAPAIAVRDLGYRWGSCHPEQRINFHWRVILLPPRIIEYVIVHELVHLIEPNHQQPFWERLNRAMPDYLQHKQWLAEYGGAM